MRPSRSFGGKRSRREHLLHGQGLGGEITDLRRDVDAAFGSLEGGNVVTTSEFYVNPSTGNDKNAGTQAAPFKTLTGLFASWGLGAILDPVGGILTVYLEGTPDWQTDALNLTGVRVRRDVVVVLEGVATAVHAGTFTAHQVQDRPSNTPNTVTDSVVDWTDFIGSRIRVTSGANAGMVAWVAAQPSAHVAFISTPQVLIGPHDGIPDSGTIGNDPYVIESLPEIVLGNIDITGDAGSSNVWAPRLMLRNLSILPPDGVDHTNWIGVPVVTSNIDVFFVGCNVRSYLTCNVSSVFNGAMFANCFLSDGYVFNIGPFASYVGGLVLDGTLFQRSAGNTIIDGDILFYNSTFFISKGGRGSIGLAAFFNVEDNDIHTPGCVYTAFGGVIEYDEQYHGQQWVLWGSGNACPGIYVDTGGFFLYEVENGNVLPYLTGSADFSLAGATTAYAFDSSANPPKYTNAIACTWANLAKTVADGGFGDNAHNLAQRASVCRLTGTT